MSQLRILEAFFSLYLFFECYALHYFNAVICRFSVMVLRDVGFRWEPTWRYVEITWGPLFRNLCCFGFTRMVIFLCEMGLARNQKLRCCF